MSSIGTAAVAVAFIVGLVPTFAEAGQAHARHAYRHKVHRGHFARTPRYDHAPRYANRYPARDGYRPASANPYPASAADDPYSPYAAPGAAIRAQARINQHAPGVTNELAPDNIATATGGPSGGVPGFSGR